MTGRSLWIAGFSTLLGAAACGGSGSADGNSQEGEAGAGSGGRAGSDGAAAGANGGAADASAGEAGASGPLGSAGAQSTAGQPGTDFGVPETLLDGLDYPVRLELDGEWIYVTVRGSLSVSNGSVVRVRKDGGGTETLAERRAAPFALSLSDDAVYWTEVPSSTARGVYRLTPGGIPERMLELTAPATALLVDSGRVYFGTTAPSGTGVLSWTTTSGAALGSLGGLTSVFDIVADPSRSWVLVLDAGDAFSETASSVRAVDAAGTEANKVELEPNGVQNGVVLGETLLFTSPARGSLASLPLGAPWSVEDEALSLDQPWGIAADDAFVYYSERAEGIDSYCVAAEGSVRALDRANLLAEPITLATGLHCPSRIAVDESGVYFVTNGVDGMSTGSVVKIPRLR